MAYKIHLRATVQGSAVCASRAIGGGKMRHNSRRTYATIPASCIVNPEEFRATADADRCAHCSDRFTETMNRRRELSGKPLYVNAFTKELRP